MLDSFIPTASQELFLDLAFDQEFGQSTDRLRKWEDDIYIYIEGQTEPEVLLAIDQVIQELNDLSTTIRLTTVAVQEEANLRLFLGEKEDYVALVEPAASGFAEGNSGFATIAWDQDNAIIRASACIDNVNFSDPSLLQHVIREELAQVLGLINDTTLDDKSIFYQLGSTQTTYSLIDQLMISYMLGDELSPGMCKEEVLDIVK
ncbi:MAG: DUF2927 domain-containing protein [Bacteroidota bacterium]